MQHAMTDLKLGSCMYCTLEFVSVIEASKLVTIEVELVSSEIECMRYIDDFLPHAPFNMHSA
jgi:hypothetical protein